jgi:uncharacterized protein YbjT (DUF2867 family)
MPEVPVAADAGTRGDGSAVAFVAGATGYTGREVVRLLRDRGVRTIAHVRPDSSALTTFRERFAALGAEVDVTPWQTAAMQATLERLRPTHLFLLLGTTKKRARADAAHGRRSDYEAVDYGLSMLLIEAATKLASSPKLIYLSAAGVGPKARGAYLEVRQRVESALAASALPYAVARPSFITGPDRDEARPLERAAAATTDALLFVARRLGGGRLTERYRSTTATALAAALVRLALDDPRARHIFESEELRGY